MNSNKVESMKIRKHIGSGAVYGALAWSVYAIAECLFTIILPWIIKPSYDYEPLHWGFTVLLFVIYPVIGLLLGGFLGLFFKVARVRIQFLEKVQPEVFLSSFATLTIVSALSVHYVILWFVVYPFKQLADFFIISSLLTGSLVLSAFSISWFKRLRFLTNTWTTCILLLGLPWITKDFLIKGFTIDKAIAAVLFFVITMFVAFVVQKRFDKRSSGNSNLFVPNFSNKYVTFMISLSLITLGMSCFLKQSPYIKNFNFEVSPLTGNHPNIILIVMDTVRADHLSLYGYERDTTPNIRNFAKEATLYPHSFSSEATDLSTTASIFTGMYVSRHGAHFSESAPYLMKPLSNELTTLAEVLSGKGYITMGSVSNFVYLSHSLHMDQGFQYFDNRLPALFFRKSQPFFLRNLIRHYLARIFLTHDYHHVYRRAEEINSVVFNLLDRIKGVKNPFFLFINYMDAHRPHIPPSPFDTLYPGKNEAINTIQNNLMNRKIMKFERELTKEERNHLISQYDGGIAYIDFHIGGLIERLKKLGLYDNTLIIITSDHGESFGERNLMEHGVSVYQDQVYIPLIIKYPNKKDESVINDLVSSVDIMPTILDVTGYEIPEDVQGVSLLKLGAAKTRSIISESFPDKGLIDLQTRFHRIERAIFSGPYKFISSTAGKKELYDISMDPGEQNNLYGSNNSVSAIFETNLNNLIKNASEKRIKD
jgi:arylsulfatase A-like enzyme